MDVSVIVPLYKGEKYISKIQQMVNENQSVLIEGELQKDIEIIFVNDYPDEKIDFNTLCHNKIPVNIYENPSNLGIHESRLRGLLKAKGTYIVFLDQDDEISPFYLQRQLKYIGNSDAVLCNGKYRSNKIIYNNEEHQRKAVLKKGYLEEGNFIVSPGQVMVKKESIPDKWKKYILKNNGSDDVLLWILMLCENKSFALNKFPDYTHKEDGENTSLNYTRMMESVEELLLLLERENLLSKDDFSIFGKLLRIKIDKYKSYAVLQENWGNILENIVNLCKKHCYKKLAIYGYGIFGKKLILDLEYKGIRPVFVIDKAAMNFKTERYEIHEPGNIPERIDLIVLTPVFDVDKIKKDLEKYDTVTISLGELI